MIDVDALRPGLPGPPTAHPRRAGLLHIFAGRSSTVGGAGQCSPASIFASPSTNKTSGRNGCSVITGPPFQSQQENVRAPSPRRKFLAEELGPRPRKQAPAEPKASAPQVIERLVDAFDGDDFHALDTLPGLVCGRDDGAVESKLRGFSQSLLTALYGPDFTCQAYFTKHKRFII